MPDRTTLKPRDRIRLLRVPDMDLRQRERELREGAEDPGWTANTIEKILAQNPVVTIDRIDEYRQPWFNYILALPDGVTEEHTIAIMEDDSWVPL